MTSPATPTNKFVVTQLARSSSNDNSGIVFTISPNPTHFHQYLGLNSHAKLQKLAKLIGINKREIKDMSHYELAVYLTERIDFQIPDELAAYERGPLRILDKFIDFQQIYIPLSEQERNTFRYRLHWACNPVQRYWRNTDSSVTTLDESRNGLRIQCKRYNPNPRIKAVEYIWNVYPFNVDTDKRDMQILCKAIGLMNFGESKIYTTEELAELLNEKFVLQERAG